MKANRKFSKDEEAVSPVIGVILMVAITVILAAVIAAFVFGMGSSLQKNYMVAATASQHGTTITVVFNGGPDAGEVTNLTLTSSTINATDITAFTTHSVGSTASAVGTGGNEDHVIVTATFSDNSSQVILDTFV